MFLANVRKKLQVFNIVLSVVMNVGSQSLHLGKCVYTSIIILNPLEEIILHVYFSH